MEKVLIHKNVWHWGRGYIIVIANGRGLCSVSVEDENPAVAHLSGVSVCESSRVWAWVMNCWNYPSNTPGKWVQKCCVYGRTRNNWWLIGTNGTDSNNKSCMMMGWLV